MLCGLCYASVDRPVTTQQGQQVRGYFWFIEFHVDAAQTTQRMLDGQAQAFPYLRAMGP